MYCNTIQKNRKALFDPLGPGRPSVTIYNKGFCIRSPVSQLVFILANDWSVHADQQEKYTGQNLTSYCLASGQPHICTCIPFPRKLFQLWAQITRQTITAAIPFLPFILANGWSICPTQQKKVHGPKSDELLSGQWPNLHLLLISKEIVPNVSWSAHCTMW